MIDDRAQVLIASQLVGRGGGHLMDQEVRTFRMPNEVG